MVFGPRRQGSWRKENSTTQGGVFRADQTRKKSPPRMSLHARQCGTKSCVSRQASCHAFPAKLFAAATRDTQRAGVDTPALRWWTMEKKTEGAGLARICWRAVRCPSSRDFYKLFPRREIFIPAVSVGRKKWTSDRYLIMDSSHELPAKG